jgi:hypothetical protein
MVVVKADDCIMSSGYFASSSCQICNTTYIHTYIHTYTYIYTWVHAHIGLRKYINDYKRVFIKPVYIQEHT